MSDNRTVAEMMGALGKEATPGPWSNDAMNDVVDMPDRQDAFSVNRPGDATLITKMRNAWPALTEAMAEYEQLVDRIAEYMGAPVTSHRAVLAEVKEELTR